MEKKNEMYLVQTELEGATEYFLIPQRFSEDSIKEVLGTIKYRISFTDWKRLNRQVVSIIPTTCEEATPYFTSQYKPAKYVKTRDSDGNIDLFIFNANIDHDCMYESLLHLADKENNEDFKAVQSAGFTTMKVCFGSSMTLGAESEETDTLLLDF